MLHLKEICNEKQSSWEKFYYRGHTVAMVHGLSLIVLTIRFETSATAIPATPARKPSHCYFLLFLSHFFSQVAHSACDTGGSIYTESGNKGQQGIEG
jgi:uncharacterized metal-binding protein